MSNILFRRSQIQAVASTDLPAPEAHHAPLEIMQGAPENDSSTPAPKPSSIATEVRTILANLAKF